MFSGNSDYAKQFPLKPYQEFAVKWQLERLYAKDQTGAGLFLDPGLGKTRITLTVLDHLFKLGELKRVLIVAPLRPLYFVWPAQVELWGFNFSYIILHGQHKTAMRENCQLELINFEGLNKIRDVKGRWDMIVIDESTYIKSWSAKRTKYLRAILPSISKRSILTGTPAANSLADLHSQMFVLDDGEALGKTVTYFRHQYMDRGGWQGRQWVIRPHLKHELLNRVYDKVLRMQIEDHVDMPQLVVNDIWCEMAPGAKRKYNQLKRELATELATGGILATNAAAAYSKCKQFANGTVYNTTDEGDKISHRAHEEKATALVDLYTELAGKPLLVFYWFTQDLHHLLSKPEFKKAPFIKGQMKLKQVESILEDWNAGKHPVLFCQYKAASHGLNMQAACNDVCCFGVVDSPETYDQAFRRVYRTGVKGSQVRIHRLLTRGTVEEVMLDRLNGKITTQEEFLTALKKHVKT